MKENVSVRLFAGRRQARPNRLGVRAMALVLGFSAAMLAYAQPRDAGIS